MTINEQLLNEFYENLDERSREALDQAAEKMTAAKRRGGKSSWPRGAAPTSTRG